MGCREAGVNLSRLQGTVQNVAGMSEVHYSRTLLAATQAYKCRSAVKVGFYDTLSLRRPLQEYGTSFPEV